MATYNGTTGNDSINIEIPYGSPGVVDVTAYGYGGNDSIIVDYPGIGGEYGHYYGVYTGSIWMYGGKGNDILSSQSYCFDHQDINEYLDIEGVSVYYFGDEGNDNLSAAREYSSVQVMGFGTDILYGGPGNDLYNIYEASDIVHEEPNAGYDIVVAASDDFEIYNLPAHCEELLLEETWVYPLTYASGNEIDNRIVGNSWENQFSGGFGNDIIYGCNGAYSYSYFPDADVLHGDAGNDKIYGGRSADDREDGPDTIYGDDGNDDVWAGGGDDQAWGSGGNDNLYGQSGNDTLRGGGGEERVYGGTGNDTLYGDAGVDVVRGGEGLDRLYGGGAGDRFEYTAAADSRPGGTTRDVIFDFEAVGATAGDRIDLADIDANPGVSGNQAFTFRGTAAFSAPGQVRVQASGTLDTLVQANVTGTSGAEMEILVNDGSALPTAWKALDFWL